ncbi:MULTISPECIES: NmrA/HSCARG family protein [Erwinia]|uniref:NmrA/HSCARG family protein n=1 Tax=Erwinia TaxID=551 RepID=UPI00054E03E8|nr:MULTISPECIES: NmrA/HSCARG family protein [Erwinia]
MISSRPLIVVFGAMSKQGRSVTRTLLESQRYRVRALTRDTTSSTAQELARLGAELKDVSLAPDKEHCLVEAFRDAFGVFLMTPGIAPASRLADTHETALGRQLADAAVTAGAEHIVFSSLENVEKISEGQLWVPHFTDKAKIEDYIRTLPVTCSFIQMAFFYTNLAEYYPPRREGDQLIFPVYLPEDFRAPFVDPLTATGPAVLEILDHREQYAGRTLPVIGEFLSPREMVETFTRITGKKAVYRSAFTREELLHHFPSFSGQDGVVDEITGMTEYAVKYGYFTPDRDVLWSRRIDPSSLTWEAFLRNTGWQGDEHTF